MDLATVAMAGLLPKLAELLKEEYKLQEGVKKDVESLSRELGSTHAAICKVAEAVPGDLLDDQVRLWANDARELSYDMEDVVDNFLVHAEGSVLASSTETLEELMKKMMAVFEKGKTLPPIANAIRGIRDQVLDVVAHANPAGTTDIFESCQLQALCKDQKELVGIEGARDEVVRRLTDGDDKNQLKILSIFGFGGLGKTTLAKAVYDCLHVQYDYGAFVHVGRSSNTKEVFKDILTELRKYNEEASLLDESQLIEKLRGLLENKRYFIVIDHICDIESWETIRCALTNDSVGSRIITTTQVFDVATKASDVYKLEPLSHDNSEKLFCKRLFTGKEKHTCDQLAEVHSKILHKCRGVALAIITVARLLSCKPRDDWSKVYNSIGSGYGDAKDIVDNTSKILLFCYYDLPLYLRICLLHLSTYPRNYMIDKQTLIWKWVAEGLINEEPGMGLFELGERYFNQLINRNMIQPEEAPYKGIIHACRVNDTMHDMLCSLASQENFATIVESNKTCTPPQSNARKLAIHNSDPGQDPLASMITSQVRSFHATMCQFSTLMPLLSSFQMLRVLAMEECKFIRYQFYHLENLGRLLQLRYLELGDTPIRELPEEIGHLRFLQVLDVRGTYIQELPSSVCLLRQLKCLLATFSLIGVQNWVGNLTSLQELSLGLVSECPNFMEDLGKLTELRKLRIRIQELDHNSRRSLAESMCNLRKIQVLNLRHGFGRSSTAGSWDGYVPPHGLRDLRIRISWSSSLPPWINSSLLPGLTHLKVELNSLETADLEILGRLPELIMLRLWTLPGIVCFPAATGSALFPKLRYCKMDLPLKFPPGAMPCLESINFRLDLLCLKDAGFDFDELSTLENLHCLERVVVWIYSMEAHERDFVKADTAVRHSVHIHPNRPILEIDCDYEYDISDSDDDGSDPDETDEEETNDENENEDEDEDEDEEEKDMHARRVRRRSI